ncbi:hypothetical protein GWO43_00930 [candidate division KSB1 bacterium]|nr:hypothetical protein [candidate division KSB1 bacterium]NIV68541.1 hypothetical protein [Phycisphaerae bacterium]NIR69096.1 hypothetical protein [candidate division KSB1 bacterium]NIS22627.1 hypothetical protein [candidate division KSB1 bacterium]NIT69485.1 hypothetical protein [candidate division KSB1 bacterium]
MTSLLTLSNSKSSQAFGVFESRNPGGEAKTDTIHVASGIVDGSFIRPFKVTWKRVPKTAAGKTLSSNLIHEKVELVKVEGQSLLKFTQVWKDSTGNTLFTTVRVADHKTLAYKAFHTGGAPGGLAHLDFKGKQVTGGYAPAPEKVLQLIGVTLEEQVFASFSGLLVSGFPLRDGYEATFPGFGWGGTTNPKLKWEHIQVLDSEEIDVAGLGKITSWIVETSRSNGLRYWVTKEPPYFVKAYSEAANGSSTTFEIVEWQRTQE